MSYLVGRPTPQTIAHAPLPSPCKRSCCWTPIMCAKNRTCDCHKGDS